MSMRFVLAHPKRGRTYGLLKRLTAFMLCGLAVFCAAVPCAAAPEGETVRVAVIDYPNYIQMNDNGTISGYAYEYLQDIRQYTGWQYDFIEMSFADATAALAKGDIDLLAGNQYTAERAALFDYSQRDMGEGGSVLCVRPDETRYCYNDYAAYDGIRIAALKGSVRIQQTQEKLAQYGAQVVFIEYDTDEASKAALENGDVDAILMSTIRCEAGYKILARLKTAPLYFCTNKQRPELKSQLDAAMEEIHLNSPYYEEQLDQKYYGAVPVQQAFTAAEEAYIKTAGTITVAVSDDLAPVEYYDAAGSSYAGLVPASFRLIAQNSGLKFRFVPRRDMDTLKRQMASGEVQLVASVANEPEIAEQWGVTLSSTYYGNSASLVTGGSLENIKNSGLTLALHSGYPYLEKIARAEGYTNFVYADTFDACISLVNQKKADIAIVPSNYADTLTHRASYAELHDYTISGSYTDFCVGVSAEANPLLLSILNKSIASISKEEQSELLLQSLAGVNETVTLQDFIAAHRVTILMTALLVAALLVIGASCLAVSRKRANQRLQAALEKADAANRAKTDFLSRMSHDMRTPMNGILGLSYLMENETDPAEMKKELPKLRESGEYLLQLINDVLDVNKVESGKIVLHPAVCEEKRVFDNIVAMVSPQIAEKGIVFRFVAKDIEWQYMLLDEQRVKQIFVNLLTNAIKFTPAGGRVWLTMEFVSQSGGRVRDKFTVRDTGIGISPDFLPRIFEPFAQENRVQEGLGGTGLGLPIVKSLVELMGGTIEVESKLDQGTTFTVYLDFPLARRPEQTSGPAEPSAPKLPEHTRILLCEDHPLNARIAIRLLEEKGADVLWKEDGQRGVEAFAAAEPGTFDAVLMDIRMPVMDGLAATRAIRAMARPDAATIPILAMTANAFEEDIRACREAGMDAHLAKPVDPDKMYALLAELIAQKRQMQEKKS